MIRGAVIHLSGEQPLLVDLEALPTAADACLVCTNVRLANGRRPAFIDHSSSTFLFPLVHVRFVEIPTETAARSDAPQLPAGPAEDEDGDGDEDFLRRVREI